MQFASSMTVKRKSALGFVFVTLLIDCIGLGIIIPIMPGLIQDLTGGSLSEASVYGGWLTFSYAIFQFLFAPVIGGLSDRFGRRPILLLSLFGLGIDYIFLAMAPSIAWLFVGRVIAGIFGASFTTVMAYIADISTPDKRSQNFGLVGVAFGLGFIIGPVIGGIFSEWGIRVPFIVAATLSLVNWLYGYFILPESLKSENRRPFNWKRANPLGALLHLRKHPALFSLVFAILLLYVAGHAAQSTWTFITMEKFSWDEKMVGYSLGAVGLMIAIVQGGLIRVVIPKVGQKNAVYIGLVMYIIGFILFAFASKEWMMFVFIIPYCLGGISGPAIQGIVSTKVGANEQGELQGIMAAMMSIASIIGPILMTSLFSYTTSADNGIYFPGSPFIMGAILTIISMGLCIRSLYKYRTPEVQPQVTVGMDQDVAN